MRRSMLNFQMKLNDMEHDAKRHRDRIFLCHIAFNKSMKKAVAHLEDMLDLVVSEYGEAPKSPRWMTSCFSYVPIPLTTECY